MEHALGESLQRTHVESITAVLEHHFDLYLCSDLCKPQLLCTLIILPCKGVAEKEFLPSSCHLHPDLAWPKRLSLPTTIW